MGGASAGLLFGSKVSWTLTESGGAVSVVPCAVATESDAAAGPSVMPGRAPKWNSWSPPTGNCVRRMWRGPPPGSDCTSTTSRVDAAPGGTDWIEGVPTAVQPLGRLTVNVRTDEPL